MNSDLGLGSIGNMGSLVIGVIGIGIAAIVLLTFAPGIIGDIDGVFQQTRPACMVDGERFTQVVAPTAGQSADDAWMKSGGGTVTKQTETTCEAARVGTTAVYTPKGTAITAGADTLGGEWKAPSSAMTALAGGSLFQLIVGVMAILVPAGALGFMAYTGSSMLANQMGGGPLAAAIGATVLIVVVGAILPEIFSPLDNLFEVLNGHRYTVFSVGIGKIGQVLGNFLGLSLIAGLVSLGSMLWKRQRMDDSQAMM